MEVTGYKIIEALGRFKRRAATLEKQLPESIFAFKDEEKLTPGQIIEAYTIAQKKRCQLEELQQIFNSRTSVIVRGQQMSLALAIKLVGMANKIVEFWQSAATSTGRDRWTAVNPLKRELDAVYATRQVDTVKATSNADDAAEYVASLRAVIAEGNGNKISIGEGTDFPQGADLFKERT